MSTEPSPAPVTPKREKLVLVAIGNDFRMVPPATARALKKHAEHINEFTERNARFGAILAGGIAIGVCLFLGCIRRKRFIEKEISRYTENFRELPEPELPEVPEPEAEA